MARFTGAGGSEGGVLTFFIGLGMAIAGAYMLTTQVQVGSSFWQIGGYSAFGLSLIPILAGVGMLFFDGSSRWGLILTFAGVVIVLAGVLMNMTIYFLPTSLFNTLMMLGLLAGGVGLVLRSVR